jgi:hypothetical protein
MTGAAAGGTAASARAALLPRLVPHDHGLAAPFAEREAGVMILSDAAPGVGTWHASPVRGLTLRWGGYLSRRGSARRSLAPIGVISLPWTAPGCRTSRARPRPLHVLGGRCRSSKTGLADAA